MNAKERELRDANRKRIQLTNNLIARMREVGFAPNPDGILRARVDAICDHLFGPFAEDFETHDVIEGSPERVLFECRVIEKMGEQLESFADALPQQAQEERIATLLGMPPGSVRRG